MIPLLLLLISIGSPARAGDVVSELAKLARSHSVTILGEVHRRSESPDLVLALADVLTTAGDCLVVALEITSDQQAIVHAAMTGRTPVLDIGIAPVIDHAAFRNMLLGLRKLVRAGRCVKVQAIAAASAKRVNRDEWMSWLVGSLAKKWRVLALVGNVHAIKAIRWLNGADERFLAGYLTRARLQVLSILQDWDEGCSRRRGRYLPIQHPRAVEAVLGTFSMLPAQAPLNVKAVADGAVIWECLQPLD